jgi:hypothetical protein
MKYSLMTAVAVIALGVAMAPATAQDTPSTKGPPVTMGDKGKLPATGTITDKVPEMGPASSATGASSGTSGSASPKGPPQTMGDEGKLPATGTVSGAVPEMRGTAPAEKPAEK